MSETDKNHDIGCPPADLTSEEAAGRPKAEHGDHGGSQAEQEGLDSQDGQDSSDGPNSPDGGSRHDSGVSLSLTEADTDDSQMVNTTASLISTVEIFKDLKETVSKLTDHDDGYKRIISSSLSQIAERLHVYLNVRDASCGEYQGFLTEIADQVADLQILIVQSRESSILTGELGTKVDETLNVLKGLLESEPSQVFLPPDSRLTMTSDDGENADVSPNTRTRRQSGSDDVSHLNEKLLKLSMENQMSQMDLNARKEEIKTLTRLRNEANAALKTAQDKYRDLKVMLEDELTCPVCLLLPSQRKMRVCVNGHLVCTACVRDTCAICRVVMDQQMYSPLAAKLLQFAEKEGAVQ